MDATRDARSRASSSGASVPPRRVAARRAVTLARGEIRIHSFWFFIFGFRGGSGGSNDALRYASVVASEFVSRRSSGGFFYRFVVGVAPRRRVVAAVVDERTRDSLHARSFRS